MKTIWTAAALAAVLAVAGCASKDEKKDVPVTDSSKPADKTAPATPGPGGTSATKPVTQPAIAGSPLKDPKNILSQRTVYFEYDSNVVKDEFRALLQAHAKYLVENRDARLRIEGHTDERGSREYNIALGQRRAEALKRVLTVLGVPEARIEAVSFGEEKPEASGNAEAAWSKNRRGVLRYAGE